MWRKIAEDYQKDSSKEKRLSGLQRSEMSFILGGSWMRFRVLGNTYCLGNNITQKVIFLINVLTRMGQNI